MKKEIYGQTRDGQSAYQYTMTNINGMEITVTNFGAILLSVMVSDKNGKKRDVVLGCESLDAYYENSNFFGSTVGPSANRIAGAAMEIDGVTYKLDKNDGENNLHSDIPNGLNKRLWNAEEGSNSVTFTIDLEDMDMGFPGNRSVQVTYTLTEDNEIKIDYKAVSDKNTVFNLTNHSFFNLAGHNAGSILGHVLKLNATHYTPVVAGAIPTGEIASVKGTPLDFTAVKKIGDEIEADFDQLKLVGGYDHNFVTDAYNGGAREIAEASEETSGITMKVYTDLPGVQLYTGNYIDHAKGKTGAVYEKRDGFCLETQYYPDSVHQKEFPSVIFGPDRAYRSTTIYQFQAEV